VREEKLPELLPDERQADMMTGQFVEQRANVPSGQVGEPSAENTRLGEPVRVVEVEKCVPDHLEHRRDTERQLRVCLEVEQEPCRD